MTPELREACVRAMHVFTTEGRVLRGAEAVIFVYDQLGWRIVRLGLIWPILPLLEVGYGVVARNRKLFARWFFRKDHGPGWRGHDRADAPPLVQETTDVPPKP